MEVGQPLPRTLDTALPPDEKELRTPAQAEARALELLNIDRVRFGLPALERDRALDAIARRAAAGLRARRVRLR